MASNNQKPTPTGNAQKPAKWDKGVVFGGLAAFGAIVIIPVTIILAFGASRAQQQQTLNQQVQAFDQQRQAILDNYLTEIDSLLINTNLVRSPQGSPTKALAAARTDTTVLSIDGVHKGILIRYLWGVHLINEPSPVIALFDTDLDGAVLDDANLWLADISQTSLVASNFSGARLYGTDLADADLSFAKLTGANLTGANLTGANLTGANIERAKYNSKPMKITIAGTSITLQPTQWPKEFNFASAGAVCVDC